MKSLYVWSLLSWHPRQGHGDEFFNFGLAVWCKDNPKDFKMAINLERPIVLFFEEQAHSNLEDPLWDTFEDVQQLLQDGKSPDIEYSKMSGMGCNKVSQALPILAENADEALMKMRKQMDI